MKVYVERDDVIKFCEWYGITALKKCIEALPTVMIDEDGKTVIHSHSKNTQIIENSGTMNFSFD